MNQQEVVLLAQLLSSMKEVSDRLEVYYNNQDKRMLEKTKKELLELQKRIDRLLA